MNSIKETFRKSLIGSNWVIIKVAIEIIDKTLIEVGEARSIELGFKSEAEEDDESKGIT